MTTKSPQKQGYHHTNLHTALQDVALDLIAERGGPHFSLRELASTLGVTHAAVYRHFADKAALLDALTVRGFEKLYQYQEADLAAAPADALEQLFALSGAYIRFAQDNPGAFWMMFGGRGDAVNTSNKQPTINAEALGTLIASITRCQRENVLIPGDPQKMAGYMVMAPHGYACYSGQDRAIIGDGAQSLSPRKLAEIALIPLLLDPPSPSQIADRYF